MNGTTPLSRMPSRPFLNDSGETIPPFALMSLDGDGVAIYDGLAVDVVAKPDTTFRREYAVNGHQAVPDGKRGHYQTGPVVIVSYDTGTPELGDGYGAKPGQWTASKNYPQCLLVRGIVSAEQKLMLARLMPIIEAYATANGSISNGASGAISIHQGELGSTTAIGSMDPTVYNAGPDVEEDDPLVVGLLNGQLAFTKLCS